MGQQYYSLKFYLNEIPCQLSAVTAEFDKNANRSYYVHKHPSFELHAVFQGNVDLQIAGRQYKVCAGQGILIAPSVYHSIRSFSDDLKKMCVSFNLSREVPQPKSKKGRESERLTSAFYAQDAMILDTDDMRELLDKICQLADGAKCCWKYERLKAYMILLLLNIYDKISTAPTLNNSGQHYSDNILYILEEYFAHNFHSNHGNTELADILHISTRQLDRVLQKYYNMNYREKLIDIRLTNAMYFLLSTDWSIAKISEKVGYSTPANFSTFIKNATGKTPSQIRREHSLHHE